MMEAGLEHALDVWEGFSLIIGGAGAALTGLQFVVMSLLDNARSRDEVATDPTAIGAFGTPTVVHFCAALLIAAILTAPWESVGGLRTALVIPGAAGLAYAAVIIIRARRQSGYKPVLEDWLFHTIFPIVAYGGLVVGGTLLRRDMQTALFVIGAMTMFLIFIGIHNAWDTVTYFMLNNGGSADSSSSAQQRSRPQSSRGARRRR